MGCVKRFLDWEIFSLDVVVLSFSVTGLRNICLTEFGVRAAGVGELDRSESSLDDLMHRRSDLQITKNVWNIHTESSSALEVLCHDLR